MKSKYGANRWAGVSFAYLYGFAPHVGVASRRAQAVRRLGELRRNGRPVTPVVIEGRKIATTFWGESWCDNLERYSDFANRLPRGRSYARHGSVIDLQIAPGVVTALVSGSDVYQVRVEVDALAESRWRAVCRDVSGAIESVIELLQGRLSDRVMTRLCADGTGLFPSPREIDFACSCPDGAWMCKHVAAGTVRRRRPARPRARPALHAAPGEGSRPRRRRRSARRGGARLRTRRRPGLAPHRRRVVAVGRLRDRGGEGTATPTFRRRFVVQDTDHAGRTASPRQGSRAEAHVERAREEDAADAGRAAANGPTHVRASSRLRVRRLSTRQYIPPMPPGPPPPGASFFSSGMSAIMASVVSSRDAIDAAFWSADRTTFVGSITPALTRSS